VGSTEELKNWGQVELARFFCFPVTEKQCHYWHLPHPWKDATMTLGLTPLISLIAGILILVMPRLLNYIVALYLIVIGLIGLFGAGGITLR